MRNTTETYYIHKNSTSIRQNEAVEEYVTDEGTIKRPTRRTKQSISEVLVGNFPEKQSRIKIAKMT